MLRIGVMVVCLMLGALANVLVAWGCVLWVQSFEAEPYSGPVAPHATWWTDHAPATWPSPPIRVSHASQWGVEGYLYHADTVRGPLFDPAVWRSQAGWPFRSMEGAQFNEPQTRTRWTESMKRIRGFWFVPAGELPTRVRWPQSIGNAILYALPLWGLYCLGIVGLRASRRRRRLCAYCRYDLRGAEHEHCPECGAAVKKRRSAAVS